jgi:hypothetical protein
METDTFISVENIFKMPSIDRRNLRLAIEEVKSSFQVPITSFQCLKGNLLTALGDKSCSLNLCYITGTLGLHVFFIFLINMSYALKLKFSKGHPFRTAGYKKSSSLDIYIL